MYARRPDTQPPRTLRQVKIYHNMIHSRSRITLAETKGVEFGSKEPNYNSKLTCFLRVEGLLGIHYSYFALLMKLSA